MSGAVKAKGLYLHKAVRPDLLSFAVGDVLTILDQSHADWWSAELGGKTGLIPAKYVQIIESAPVAVAAAPAAAVAEPAAATDDLGRGVALYDCNPPRADVLGFKKGEIIVLISQSSEEWYVGEIDGRQGLVAKNYIRLLPSELVRQDVKSPRVPSVKVAPIVRAPVPGKAAVSPRPASGGAPKPAAPVAAPSAPVKSAPRVAPTTAPPPTKVASPGRPFVAIADYVGARDNVLSFSKGDLITIIDQTRTDWWRGVLRGRTGAVPATYVRPAPEKNASESPAPEKAASSLTTASSSLAEEERRGRRSTIVAAPDVAAKMRAAAEQQKKAKFGTALYPFQQQKPGVLVFKRGDTMTILDDSRSDWWKAELNGKVGMVPAKYVEIRPENTPTNPAAAATASGAASSGVAPGVNPGVPAPAKAPAAPVAVQRLMAMQFFKSPRPDILGLEPGMEMTLLGKPSPDWWKVELRGRVGLVPAKLVQPLVRPQEAAATGNTSQPLVDSAATLRTQKAQQMASAAAVAQGRAPAVGAPLAAAMAVAATASPLHFSPAVGDTVEALIGATWQRALVVGVQDEGFVVSTSEGQPPLFATRVRKSHPVAPLLAPGAPLQQPASLSLPEQDGPVKKTPVPVPVSAPPVKTPLAPTPVKKIPPALKLETNGGGGGAPPPIGVVSPRKPTVSEQAPPAPVSPRKPSVPAAVTQQQQQQQHQQQPEHTPVVASIPVVSNPNSNRGSDNGSGGGVVSSAPIVVSSPRRPSAQQVQADDFEEVRQEAKRRAESSVSGSLTGGGGGYLGGSLDLGGLTGVTMADLDRALAVAGVVTSGGNGEDEAMQSAPVGAGNFAVGQAVEALFSGVDDWYAATVVEVKKSVASGEVKYVVRYDEYGNEKLLPASSLRSVEAPPEVAEIATPNAMRYEVGATIEAQYAEDQEWYVAQVNAHTPEGNYFITFVEYGNYQECTPAMVRDLTVPVEEVLPLLNEIPKGGFNLRFKVNDEIKARYAEDGKFYSAVVKGITPLGTYWVVFSEYGNEQEATENDVIGPHE